MSEESIIKATPHPATVETLAADMHTLGLAAGQTVIVHSALSKLGWVCGGAVAVIQALQTVLTSAGTLVMPTHSADLSDPAGWVNPPVPEVWIEPIRATMPAYDPDLTPTRGMGTIPETFRRAPGVVRSMHPLLSFAAWGQHAALITADHVLDSSMGDGSPLARIYDVDGQVLLLGVGHGNNTSLHLAETRAEWPGKRNKEHSAPLLVDGQRQWVQYDDLDYSEDDFADLGAAFNATGSVTTGAIAQATAILMPQRALVDFAVTWMQNRRK